MGSVIQVKAWSHSSPWDPLVPPVVCLQQTSVSAVLTSGLIPWCWDEAHQNQKSSEGYRKTKGVSLGEVSASDGIFCNSKGLSPGTQQTVGRSQGPSLASFRCWTTGTGFTCIKTLHVQSTVV